MSSYNDVTKLFDSVKDANQAIDAKKASDAIKKMSSGLTFIKDTAFKGIVFIDTASKQKGGDDEKDENITAKQKYAFYLKLID